MALRCMRLLLTPPARPALYREIRAPLASRPFTVAAALHGPKPLPPRPTINEDDITESFLKGSGPGGQKIVLHAPSPFLQVRTNCAVQNKTSSAVQLKHLPTGIVIKYQGTRSRTQNRKTARRMLAERLEEMEKGDESRTQIKRAAQAKKKASKAKKSKRKYKALEEAKKAAAGGDAADIPADDAHGEEDEEWEEFDDESIDQKDAPPTNRPESRPRDP
ncbi:putative peptide chain release factor-like protein, mitochondrial [Diplodia seriata]|uniref:Putative peptide chain release factor-like protein, mitochondrial n=1 Tax=Diplodia seriata TaxID=420778 RepID=A0A1S8BCR4_9PEZI|nr:putative peptide chain release factor-like protein, mitochondrial [Diplodia seriata]